MFSSSFLPKFPSTTSFLSIVLFFPSVPLIFISYLWFYLQY
jgi:hypothetical protein